MALPPLIVASLLIELIFAFKCASGKVLESESAEELAVAPPQSHRSGLQSKRRQSYCRTRKMKCISMPMKVAVLLLAIISSLHLASAQVAAGRNLRRLQDETEEEVSSTLQILEPESLNKVGGYDHRKGMLLSNEGGLDYHVCTFAIHLPFCSVFNALNHFVYLLYHFHFCILLSHSSIHTQPCSASQPPPAPYLTTCITPKTHSAM